MTVLYFFYDFSVSTMTTLFPIGIWNVMVRFLMLHTKEKLKPYDVGQLVLSNCNFVRVNDTL